MSGQSNDTQVCRQDDNVLETGTIPIVFVPGVMGSRISIPGGVDWDPDAKVTGMLPGWIMALPSAASKKLAPPAGGESAAPLLRAASGLKGDQEQRGWGEVAKDFYRKILVALDGMRFGNYKTPVYAAGYDWRQSNTVSGTYLAKHIGDILKAHEADHFVMVSHSMGGLATRACLKGSDDIRGKCLGIIHVAQPVDGAPVFIRRMFDGAAQDGFVMSHLLGSDRVSFQKVVSRSTGPLQLLVTPNYRDRGGAWWYTYNTFERPTVLKAWEGESWALYKQANGSPPGLLAPVGTRGAIGEPYRSKFLANIDNAKTFHDDMQHWKHDGKTWTIYGTGAVGGKLKTDTRSHLDLPPENPTVSFWGTVGAQLNPFGPGVRYKATRADGTEVGLDPDEAFPFNRGYNKQKSESVYGDGTVPATSAQALFPGESQRYAVGTDYGQKHQFEVVHAKGDSAEHDKICDHSDCVKLVREIITHIIALPHS